MPRKPSSRPAVIEALKALSLEGLRAEKHLFISYFSAKTVAERAGVSEGTARRHLEGCIGYLGYRATRIHGIRAYRYDEWT